MNIQEIGARLNAILAIKTAPYPRQDHEVAILVASHIGVIEIAEQLFFEAKRLTAENQQIKADQMILRQIVENGHHPMDKERIIRLSMKIGELTAENERLTKRCDAAVDWIKENCGCDGCYHWKGNGAFYACYSEHQCESGECFEWREEGKP